MNAHVAGMIAVAVLLVATACGEPDVDLIIGERSDGQQVLDHADVLAAGELADRLGDLREEEGVDIVAVAFESSEASLGHADRAGREVLDAWDADIVMVAVAEPGDFFSEEEAMRQRYFGVVAADRFAISRAARERIVEERAPPLAEANDWVGVFAVALEELKADLDAVGEEDQ